MPPLTVLLNRRSGAHDVLAVAAALRQVCAERGVAVDVRLLARPELLAVELHRLLAEGADRVLVGGGDGTISSAADLLQDTRMALGVLPLGTFNYFARALKLPADPVAALHLLLDGDIERRDVATVNGRVFLNNLSFGLYTGILKYREVYKARLGRSKAVAFLSGLAATLWLHPLLKLQVQMDGGISRLIRTPLAFVGANPNQLDLWGLRNPACDDRLTLLITRPAGRIGLIWLALRALFRSLGHCAALESHCVERLELGHRRRSMRVALDGEIIRLKTPLVVTLRRQALLLIVPRTLADA